MPHSTKICLIRHGETDWNVVHRLQGHTDIPLNATGLAQAQATAAALGSVHFDAMYCSDLQRAAKTAQIIAAPRKQQVIAEPRLRERHFGAFQGLTWDEAKERYPSHYTPLRERVVHANPPDGGESLAVFSERITAVLQEIAARHPAQTVLVVCHGGCLDVAYRAATGKPLSALRDFPLSNATLNWLSIGQQGWHLDKWNEENHLVDTREEVST